MTTADTPTNAQKTGPQKSENKIYLKDYTPPAYLIDDVQLTFRLHPTKTRVISRIAFRPNPEARDATFFLHGENLALISAKIDGQDITPEISDTGLTATAPQAPFIWEAEVEISPATNTALEGLYMSPLQDESTKETKASAAPASSAMYCTQCEAEGFRKITYYPDRPDVMAVFTVRIESDAPVQLSNGNPVAREDGVVEWHDPWPKPAYLFALVAGDLVNHAGSFTTRSNREVALNIWVRPQDAQKCAFSMDALKRSMSWDEEVYGREYDLDVFNVVAVDDFNMGAMENKGLNIFNSAAVLASPETSTDANYARIETIIAHEYFHNWTGNRITCRDWFQLCLKEGLTVFRDQQFSGDMRSAAVERISDVKTLRARQFREDNGPLSHPVRPESFVEINNFYTATVYEKGAEVIRMLKTLIGDAAYYEGCALYFTRHDGQACTIEDWLRCFEDVTGRDLSQFKLWYTQAGTPRVKVREDFTDGTYTLTFEQSLPRTDAKKSPDQPANEPMVLPIAVGLLDQEGRELQPTQICEVTDRIHKFRFPDLAHKPVPSILRGFSAPVILDHDRPAGEDVFLLAHDSDPFNRWEAAQRLGRNVLMGMVRGDGDSVDPDYLDALVKLAQDSEFDPAFKALALELPSEDDIAQTLFETGTIPEPCAIFAAKQRVKQSIAETMQDMLPQIYAQMQIDGPYDPCARDAGKRAWGNQALAMISRLDGGTQAARQFGDADNMTQQLAALTCLLRCGKGETENDVFYEQWRQDPLVLNKWFALQIGCAKPEDAAARCEELTRHKDFDMTNPNRFRALFASLPGNTAGFHHPGGAAYGLLADWLIKLDAKNPQIAARMSTAFETWKRYDPARQEKMRAALHKIEQSSGLSADLNEMVSRMLSA